MVVKVFLMHSRQFLPPIEDALLCAATRFPLRRATETLQDLNKGAPRGHIWELLRPSRVLAGQHQNLSTPGQSELWEMPGADVPRKVPNISFEFKKSTATTERP